MFNLLIFLLPMVHAAPVAFQAASAPADEYKAYLAAHRDYKAPAEAFMALHPSEENRNRLFLQFADAQEAFLSQDLATARRKFTALVEERTADDWSETERGILVQGALRLAQLSDTESERKNWLLVALSVDPAPSVDESLFPPPLMHAWRALRDQTTTWTLPTDAPTSEWDRVLINGVPCAPATGAKFFVTGQEVRVTYLSNRWEPVSRIVRVEAIAGLRPPQKPWVMGRCRAPVFSSATKIFAEKIAFFDESCLKAALTPVDLNPRPEAPDAKAVGVFTDPVAPRPLYKSPWLWAGVGTAIAIFVAVSQKRADRTEPSTTYGY